MSINEAAEHFGISKEAIHNRIRRGSLQSVVQEGVKFVLVDENAPKRTLQRNTIAKATLNDERYYKLLEEQNAKLQSRVAFLETETRDLRDQKEQMLIEERIKIEKIYQEKDEQLKNILSSISSQFMLNTPLQKEDEHFEAEIEEVQVVQAKPQLVSLKKYLKKLDISQKKREKIAKKFQKRVHEERVIVKKNKLYLDEANYSYQDLL